MLDRKELTRDTERLFKDPVHILESEELTLDEKVRVLENWKLDLVELVRASEENMAGEEGDDARVSERLQAVNEALAVAKRKVARATGSS